jgi:ABC-type phosphate transport system substrate-binding protein
LAEVAIVVHPSVTDTINKEDLSRVFLGKAKSLDGGHKVTPLNLPEGNATREEFNDKVLGKNDSQLKSYWSKLIFTGKGQPPKEIGSDREVKQLIAADSGLIGYIDAASVDDSVKVLVKY